MLCIFHICLFKSLSHFLLESFTSPSWEVVYCSLFTYVLRYVMGGMLLKNQNSCHICAQHPINESSVMNFNNETSLRYQQCSISGRLTRLLEAIPVSFQSCIGGQQLFENRGRHGCSVLGPTFLEGNPQYMAKCTKIVSLAAHWLAQKN